MVSRHFEIFFSNICRLLWKRMKRPRWTMTATSLKKCLNVPVPVVCIEICWCVQQSKQCYHFKIKESVQSHTTKVPSANKEEQECRVCDKRTFWTKMRAIHTNTKTHVYTQRRACWHMFEMYTQRHYLSDGPSNFIPRCFALYISLCMYVYHFFLLC